MNLPPILFLRTIGNFVANIEKKRKKLVKCKLIIILRPQSKHPTYCTMTKKEKFHIEYVFDNVSLLSLWNHVTTPFGLSDWFADSVKITGSVYTFSWQKIKQSAQVIEEEPHELIRFRWEDEEASDAYFGFRIRVIELTGSTVFEITDFALPAEKADAIHLWETQVETLKRTLGI